MTGEKTMYSLATEENANDTATSATPKALQIYPPPTDLVSEFWRDKYEREAKKYWDIFYKRNSDKFFKDRHYLHKEWGIYFQRMGHSTSGRSKHAGDSNEAHIVLEVGCGVGNTLFPLLETYPNIFVHACDFSQRAVNWVKAHKDYTEERIHVFACDVTCENLTSFILPESVDVATMVFCLSAVSPDKMPQVLQNLKKVLKPNGHVLIRDYALGDLAQERLAKKIQKISQNFYVRGDGTRAYYFTKPGLIELFKGEGYACETVKVHEKTVENHARDLSMDRRWIQGAFRAEVALDIPDTMLSSEEVDLSEGVASSMFGVPVFEVIPVVVDGRVFQIKSLLKEYQHSCKGTGLMLWESALVLASLLSRNTSALAGKTVLELGCGSVGLCSMVAATVAKLVLATDGDADALALLSDNLKANKSQKHLFKDTLYTKHLKWGCSEQIEEVKKQMDGQGFDMIIGSDVTYVAEAVPMLFKTAKALIAEARRGKPEPLLVLCHIERHVNEASIVDTARESGFILEDRWPQDMALPHNSGNCSSTVRLIFPCGLEEAFELHAVVQLFCFKQVWKD